jgi:hypothetical protein
MTLRPRALRAFALLAALGLAAGSSRAFADDQDDVYQQQQEAFQRRASDDEATVIDSGRVG